jgi:hypothetical protein
MLQSAQDARPRQRSMLEESLAGESMTYHPYGPDSDEA